MKYDMMKCIVEEDIFSRGYWASSVEDWAVRSEDGGLTFTYELDNAPTKATLGQDWFIPADDVDMKKNLCTPFDATVVEE